MVMVTGSKRNILRFLNISMGYKHAVLHLLLLWLKSQATFLCNPICAWIFTIRNIPLAGMNMTNVIMSYYIEVINVMLMLSGIPLIYVIWIQPLPFFLAQFVVIASHCCGSLIVTLGSAVSCFQIVYVTKFEILFSLDPQKVGFRTFVFITIIIVLPNMISGIFNTFGEQPVDKGVTFFTQKEYNSEGVQFLLSYSLFWTIGYVIVRFIAFVFLPLFYKKKVNHQNLHMEPPKTISLKRYLIGSLGFIIILTSSVFFSEPDDRKRLKITNLFSLFAFDLLLVYHLGEKDAKHAAKRYLFNVFHITEEENHNERRLVSSTINQLHQQVQHSSQAEISNEGISTIQMVQRGTFIAVSPLTTED
jgi:hypothetical protein